MPIGEFHCWGWGGAAHLPDDHSGGVVSQEYNIFGVGKIQLQGVENQDGTPRAVVGGTGRFRKARGDASESADGRTMFEGRGQFVITFNSIKAKK